MTGDYTSPVALARQALERYAEKRRDATSRELFWSGELWARRYYAMIAAEDDRDQQLAQQAADPQLSRAGQSYYDELRYDQLKADLVWYDQMVAADRSLLENWQAQPAIDLNDLDDLRASLELLTFRRCERAALLAQAALEAAERRRVDGLRSPDFWARKWEELRAIWAEEEASFGLPEDLGDPRRLSYLERLALAERTARLDRRLAWLRQLRERQHASRPQIRQAGGTEALRAEIGLVEEEIARLAPPPPRSGGGGLILAGIIAIVLLGGLWLWRQGGLPRPPGQEGSASLAGWAGGAPTPEPTAAGLEGLMRQARALLATGRAAEAALLFEQALQLAPGHDGPLSGLAFCRYEEGDYSQALILWEQALSANPENPDARAGYATALYLSGNQDFGLANYRQAISSDPGYADEQFLREARGWSERAISDSRQVRAAMIAP